jgi:hypothetical protein
MASIEFSQAERIMVVYISCEKPVHAVNEGSHTVHGMCIYKACDSEFVILIPM